MTNWPQIQCVVLIRPELGFTASSVMAAAWAAPPDDDDASVDTRGYRGALLTAPPGCSRLPRCFFVSVSI